MSQETSTKLLWSGPDTVRTAREVLNQHGRLELDLSADLHHTLFAYLCPDNPDRIETLDVRGGAELLRRVAQIRGLDAIAELADVVAAAGGEVRVVSPGPALLVTLPEKA